MPLPWALLLALGALGQAAALTFDPDSPPSAGVVLGQSGRALADRLGTPRRTLADRFGAPRRTLADRFGNASRHSPGNASKHRPPPHLPPPQIPRRSDGLVDVTRVLQNDPPGVYYAVMEPLSAATSMSFKTTEGPDFVKSLQHATIPSSWGCQWRREKSDLLNPPGVGVKAAAFVCDAEKLAIVAFKGSCTNTALKQCRADRCYLARTFVLGYMTAEYFGMARDPTCKEFSRDQLDYFTQAHRYVQSVIAAFPGYALLLTGYSMGGHLAILAASVEPGSAQAVTFAPTPFYSAWRDDLKLSADWNKNLRSEDLVAIGDIYDMAISLHFDRKARKGAVTCLINSGDEPAACRQFTQRERLAMYDDTIRLTDDEVKTFLTCKHIVHEWSRYRLLVLSDPPHLQCSAAYSFNKSPKPNKTMPSQPIPVHGT